jgi:hypothetical protein
MFEREAYLAQRSRSGAFCPSQDDAAPRATTTKPRIVVSARWGVSVKHCMVEPRSACAAALSKEECVRRVAATIFARSPRDGQNLDFEPMDTQNRQAEKVNNLRSQRKGGRGQCDTSDIYRDVN